MMQRTIYHAFSLTRPQRHRLWTMRAVLAILLIIGIIAITRQLLFPVYHFHFRAAIDSLANTISRPFETAHGTAFDVGTVGDFTVAHITITLPKDAPALPVGTTLALHHTYAAFLAPFADTPYRPHIASIIICGDTYRARGADGTLYTLANKAVADSYILTDRDARDATDPLCTADAPTRRGFQPGTLIASADSVFVTDTDGMYPFQDTLSFDAMGYNFDNVYNTTAHDRAPYKKMRRLDMRGTHPSGTIFYAADTNNMYITDNAMLYKMPVDATAKKIAITAAEASRDTVATCTLRRSLLAPRSYSCRMPLDAVAAFPGNTFRFTIDAPSVAIDRAHVTLTTAITADTLRYRFRTLKNELTTVYAQQD